MRGAFKLPSKILNPLGKPSVNNKVAQNSNNKAVIDNDVYSSPYEVRVRPPADYVAPSPTIIRLGRSLSDLPVLSDEDAQQLIGAVH